jgi:hypothetical protein
VLNGETARRGISTTFIARRRAAIVKISREWAMPSSETFSIKPIAELLDRWLPEHAIVDPFARDSKRASYTNDLNPASTAQFHLDARDYLDDLLRGGLRGGMRAALFDPPYSPRQVMECYQRVGRRFGREDGQNSRLYRETKDRIADLLQPGGIAISCAWNSVGFGKCRGFELEEILLVSHGAAHNDTIVTVERKVVA